VSADRDHSAAERHHAPDGHLTADHLAVANRHRDLTADHLFADQHHLM
jgi:hypothetical protein